jgi:pyridoxal phosphate enzyme (YggS family)
VILARLEEVRRRMARAAERAGRDPQTVTLVAVSKTHPVESLRVAHAAGVQVFGENYVQELLRKQAALAGLDLSWHLVGRLQRNKAKDVVGRVALVHSVDSAPLAEALARRAAAAGVVQDVLVEVNLAGESSKAGVAEAGLDALLEAIAPLSSLRCLGLMTMPPPTDDPEASRPAFRALARLAAARGLVELSMGMTGDFEVAIEEGATLVRVGTAIFGERS